MRHLLTGPHDVQLPLALDWCSRMASSGQSEDRGYPQDSRLALLCGVFIVYPSSPPADARRRTKIIAKRSLPPDAVCRRR